MNYTQLNTECQCYYDLIKFIHSPQTVWFDTHGFTVARVPAGIYNKDSTIAKLVKQFKADPVILKMHPMIFYRFHIDAFRQATVNMLLEGFDSHCYYGSPYKHEELMQLEELVYKEKKLYLLNTQTPHAVLNKSQPRTLFSLGINQPYTYTQVKEYINDNRL